MKIYHGERTARGCEVTVDGRPLQKRSDLTGNATTPFDWGYIGTGQLSVALLSDFLCDDSKAMVLAEPFERNVVAALPSESWTMTDRELAAALEPWMGMNCNRLPEDDEPVAFGDMPIETASIAPQTVEVHDAAGAGSMLNEGGR